MSAPPSSMAGLSPVLSREFENCKCKLDSEVRIKLHMYFTLHDCTDRLYSLQCIVRRLLLISGSIIIVPAATTDDGAPKHMLGIVRGIKGNYKVGHDIILDLAIWESNLAVRISHSSTTQAQHFPGLFR